jgi:hypothetical protein
MTELLSRELTQPKLEDGDLEELEDVEDERVTQAELYRIFENNPQQAGRILTVAQAELLEATGHPWPVSGDRTVKQPLRRGLRKLTAPGIGADLPLAGLTVARWLEWWLHAVEEAERDDPTVDVYTGTDRQTLRETPAGMRAMMVTARRHQVTEYLIPNLTSYNLVYFAEPDVEALAAALIKMPGKRSSSLSRSTLRSVMAHLKKALQVAYDKEIIDSNPAKSFAKYLGIEPRSAEWWADYRQRYAARLNGTDELEQEL